MFLDSVKAEMLAERLAGETLAGWSIDRLINFGKSAAVFAGSKNEQLAAIKVFDTELIERYGDQAQLSRIERELELKGSSHSNLVTIYDGGHDKEKDLYFIVMEYLDGPNLKDALLDIDDKDIPHLTAQLANAAKHLEDMGLVHRDIKPENIAVLDNHKRLVLLDFGVIRPIKGSELTDGDGIQAFIGTLQYSSPEFLLRDERQDVDGYRALTFYQIGAVIHDMIMKRPIFDQFATPYGKLVVAVRDERPLIKSADVPNWLIQLAERCLLKDPNTRTRVVNWSDFHRVETELQSSSKDRVLERLITVRAQSQDKIGEKVENRNDEKQIRKAINDLLTSAAISSRTSTAGLPAIRTARVQTDPTCLDIIFQKSAVLGFPHGLTVRTFNEIIDVNESVISCVGVAFFPKSEIGSPDRVGAGDPWFERPLDNVLLHQAFEGFLFQAIEWCLQVSPALTGTASQTFISKLETQ